MKEIYKDIPNYKNLYQISNLGNVKSLERICPSGRLIKERILKQSLSNRGYYQVNLAKNGSYKRFNVHRLVALVFVPNPNKYEDAHHVDEIKTHNTSDNIQWVNHVYNCNYGNKNKKISKSIKAINIETLEETIFPSILKASKLLNIDRKAIRDVLNKRRKDYKNFYFDYN